MVYNDEKESLFPERQVLDLKKWNFEFVRHFLGIVKWAWMLLLIV